MPASRPLIKALALAVAFACCRDAGFNAFSQAFVWALAFAFGPDPGLKAFYRNPYLCLALTCCPDAGFKAFNPSPYLGICLCLLPRCPVLRPLIETLSWAPAFAFGPDPGFRAFE